MVQKECQQVKAMLKELKALVPHIEALKKYNDSGEDTKEIKQTIEDLQSIIHKHRVLRRNLKEWERRSKKIQRIDKIVEKLDKGGSTIDLSIDELHTIYITEVWKTEDGVFNFEPTINGEEYEETYHSLVFCREKRKGAEKQKEDYARIYGCKPEQVTSNLDNVFKKNSDIVVFIGDINFTEKELPKTLKHVSGTMTSDDNKVTLPKNLEYTGRCLYLGSLESAKGVILPKTIGLCLNLGSLKSAKELVLPETIGDFLELTSLTSADGLEKLNYAGIVGDICLPDNLPTEDRDMVTAIQEKLNKAGINVNFAYISV